MAETIDTIKHSKPFRSNIKIYIYIERAACQCHCPCSTKEQIAFLAWSYRLFRSLCLFTFVYALIVFGAVQCSDARACEGGESNVTYELICCVYKNVSLVWLSLLLKSTEKCQTACHFIGPSTTFAEATWMGPRFFSYCRTKTISNTLRKFSIIKSAISKYSNNFINPYCE